MTKDYSLRNYPSHLSLKQHVLNIITRDRDMQPQPRGVHEVANRDKKNKVKVDDWWTGEGAWQGEEEWPEGEEGNEAGGDWTSVNALKGGSKGKGKGKQGKGDGVFHG